MSRSFKKHAATQDLKSGFRDYENRKRKLREKQRLNKGEEVISDEKFDRSISLYSNNFLHFPIRK